MVPGRPQRSPLQHQCFRVVQHLHFRGLVPQELAPHRLVPRYLPYRYQPTVPTVLYRTVPTYLLYLLYCRYCTVPPTYGTGTVPNYCVIYLSSPPAWKTRPLGGQLVQPPVGGSDRQLQGAQRGVCVPPRELHGQDAAAGRGVLCSPERSMEKTAQVYSRLVFISSGLNL